MNNVERARGTFLRLRYMGARLRTLIRGPFFALRNEQRVHLTVVKCFLLTNQLDYAVCANRPMRRVQLCQRMCSQIHKRQLG